MNNTINPSNQKIYYCYKATNKENGKIYIGFATNPQSRWRNHKNDADKGRGYVFHDAIRKHGWHQFIFEIICCGKNKREMLEFVEPALIEQYQSSIGQNGYNMHRKVFGASVRDVDKRGTRTPEQRERMTAAAKRRVETPEARSAISDGLKRHFSTHEHPRKGIRLVEPKRRLVSEYDPAISLLDYVNQNLLTKRDGLKPPYCREGRLKQIGVWDYLVAQTSFLPETASIGERFYCVRNGLVQQPTCMMCPNLVNFSESRKTKSLSYLTTCSPTCGRLKVLACSVNAAM